jgi:DNA-binding response OmpR family regulator
MLMDPCFDDARKRVVVEGKIRHLQPGAWRMLTVLRERFERVVPRDMLITMAAAVPANGGSLISMRVQMSALRVALAGSPYVIVNRYGNGYGLFRAEDV